MARLSGRHAAAFAAATAVATAVATAAPLCWAQGYPSRPVQLVVAYAPGGTGDVVARVIAEKLTAAFGQSVIVENRSGASGAIGAQSVVRAAPDGYTLLAGQTAEVAINQNFVKGLGYDPDKDLQPIALAAVVPLALVVPATAPYATVKEMLEAPRSRTEGLSFASAGTGTPGHFAGELLKIRSKVKLVHVPYKGAGPALNDLLGGHVDFYFSGLPAAMPHVKSGRLKILALSSAKRSPAAPGVPTVLESGIKDFDLTLWVGFFAPRATPKEIVTRLNQEINKVLAQPEVRERLQGEGAEVPAMSVEQFASFVRAESVKYQQIIEASGVRPD
jgi:tripartite-type tricarboxylate transporter receptor subunit TctC